MNNLSESEAQDLIKKTLALSQAESCIVAIDGSTGRHIRYAQGMATTSGSPNSFEITVESHFGKRSGSATGNDLTDSGLASLVAAAEEVAKRAPENPEFMPPLGPQQYVAGTGFMAATEGAGSDFLAASISPLLQEAQAKNLQVSGYLETGSGFSSMGTSAGLFVHDRQTSVLHTVTARTPDGTGSGWAGMTLSDIGRLDAAAMGSVAIDKAIRSQKPTPLEPGKYTVILEPSGVSDLIGMLIEGYFDQRSADEGRSFATKKGGGSRVGEMLFGPMATLYSDPHDPVVPGSIFSNDGLPAVRTVWIENGVLKNLQCSRYWAQKSGRTPMPSPTTLTMAGGTTTTEAMIKQTKRGLLITRFWYIREVDPQTVLLTGLTRDGVFLIENGEITRPVRNFRFNESPVAMLGKMTALGPSVRTYGYEIEDMPICAPTIMVEDFELSSVSDAV